MSENTEIVSKMRSLSDILMDDSSSVYFIPDYQRGFVWEGEHVKQLWEDMCEDSNGFTVDSAKLEGYLLGNIVLIAK